MDIIKAVIIDDSDFFRVYLKDVLSKLKIEIAGDFGIGEEFLNHALAGKYEDVELILLDINMPQRSGVDLIEDLLDALPDAIIVMISTMNDMDLVSRCLDLGASNFITKTSTNESLMDVIKSTMELNGFELE
jgi:DNA-binding NarL/FixJ family response regulator